MPDPSVSDILAAIHEQTKAIAAQTQATSELVKLVGYGALQGVHPIDRSMAEDAAKTFVTDRHLFKLEPHTSENLIAMINWDPRRENADGSIGAWKSHNEGDEDKIKAFRWPKLLHRGRGVAIEGQTLKTHGDERKFDSCLAHLEAVIALPIKGSLRTAHIRAVRNHRNEPTGGRPVKAERLSAVSLRMVASGGEFERLVLRAVTLVGGRRYTYDPACPYGSAGLDAPRRVRITQLGGKKTRDEYSGEFEFCDGWASKWYPTLAAKLPASGQWQPLVVIPERVLVPGGGLTGYGQETRTELGLTPRTPAITPQCDDVYEAAV